MDSAPARSSPGRYERYALLLAQAVGGLTTGRRLTSCTVQPRRHHRRPDFDWASTATLFEDAIVPSRFQEPRRQDRRPGIDINRLSRNVRGGPRPHAVSHRDLRPARPLRHRLRQLDPQLRARRKLPGHARRNARRERIVFSGAGAPVRNRAPRRTGRACGKRPALPGKCPRIPGTMPRTTRERVNPHAAGVVSIEGMRPFQQHEVAAHA